MEDKFLPNIDQENNVVYPDYIPHPILMDDYSVDKDEYNGFNANSHHELLEEFSNESELMVDICLEGEKCNSDKNSVANEMDKTDQGHTEGDYTDQGNLIETKKTVHENDKKRCCNCKNSQCLKLYCECFAERGYCSGCNCTNCHNIPECEDERLGAISKINKKNPLGFMRTQTVNKILIEIGRAHV